MPLQDANPTPSFGGFGLKDTVRANPLRDAYEGCYEHHRDARALDLLRQRSAATRPGASS